MIVDAPWNCSPNECVALSVYLNASDLLKGSVSDDKLVFSLPRLPFLLCLWCGKIPGSILGTLPHGTHQPCEAHVFGFLQPTHQPLLHDGYELFIAELSVPLGRQTVDRRDDEITEEQAITSYWQFL